MPVSQLLEIPNGNCYSYGSVVSSNLPSTAYKKSFEIVSTATTDTTEQAQARDSLKVDITMGAKLILLAIGLAMLTALVWLWRKQSVAVNSAFSVADEFGAKAVRIVKDKFSGAVATDQKSMLHQIIAELEAERGKSLNRTKK